MENVFQIYFWIIFNYNDIGKNITTQYEINMF